MSDTLAAPVATDEKLIIPSQLRREKLLRWGNLLAQFISVQIVVQVLGLAAGLLLVRTLSQREYAFFTIANSMQATLLLLADVGVGSALSAVGGKIWQDRQRFGELIQTGLHIRKTLAWASLIISVPVLCILLMRGGASLLYALALTAVVLLGAGFRLTGDVLTIVPLMHGRVDQLQKKDLYASGLRLALIGAACLLFVNAGIAILAASLAFGVQYVLARQWAAEGANLHAPVNVEDRNMMWTVIRQQAPSVIYYCAQGQLTVFLISIFGSTKTIAEVGALGRLAVLFSIVGSVMSSIVLPRWARCQDRVRLKKMWWQIMGGFVCLSAFLIGLAVWLPGPFLWMLGKSYAHLETELVYIIFSAIVGNLVGTIYSLNAARGWTEQSWFAIPIVLCGQIVLAHMLRLNTVSGVALLSSLPFIPSVIPYLYRTYKSLH